MSLQHDAFVHMNMNIYMKREGCAPMMPSKVKDELQGQLLRDPDMTIHELQQALRELGHEPSKLVVSDLCRDFLGTLRLLRLHGLLREDALDEMQRRRKPTPAQRSRARAEWGRPPRPIPSAEPEERPKPEVPA